MVVIIHRVPFLVGHVLWDLSNAPAIGKIVIIGINATLWGPTLVPATDLLGPLSGLFVAIVSMFIMPGTVVALSSRHGSQ